MRYTNSSVLCPAEDSEFDFHDAKEGSSEHVLRPDSPETLRHNDEGSVMGQSLYGYVAVYMRV